jgi:heptosyltransferase-2
MSGARLGRQARVLVRLPAWLGDFVMSEPIVRALAAWLAGGTLTLCARAEHLALFEGRFPHAGRISVERGRAAARAWRGHDAAFLCTGSFRSAWRAFTAGIPRRVGFARDGRGLLLTDALAPARERGATPLGLGRPGGGRRFLPRPLERSLAELLGCLGVPVRDARPRLELQPAWLGAARARRQRLGLAPDEPYLLANVGARPGSAKGCAPELWRAVLDELERRTGLPLLLVCGPGEEAVLAAARDGLRAARAVVGPPAALPELAALCAEARLVLTADSGPRHVARALGAAVVSVAGPTDPRHTAGERGREVLVRTVVPCGPCHRERCPLAGEDHHACMTRIEPERVVAAALGLLARAPSVTIPAAPRPGSDEP